MEPGARCRSQTIGRAETRQLPGGFNKRLAAATCPWKTGAAAEHRMGEHRARTWRLHFVKERIDVPPGKSGPGRPQTPQAFVSSSMRQVPEPAK